MISDRVHLLILWLILFVACIYFGAMFGTFLRYLFDPSMLP